MSDASFYVVYLRPAEKGTLADIRAKMDLALDWYRIDSNCWVLYTTSSADRLTRRLEEFAKGTKEDGKLFVCRLDITDRQGWMNQEFWKWIREVRD